MHRNHFRKRLFIKTVTIFVAVTLIFCSAIAQNRDYKFTRIKADNGLLNTGIKCIYQDSQGFMWIASVNGLHRYDGYRFKSYYAQLRQPDALQTNLVSRVFEDSKFRLWVSTEATGVYLLDRKTDKFIRFNTTVTKPENTINGIFEFVEDGNGDIWIRGWRTIYKLNTVTNEFEDYAKQIGLAKDNLPLYITPDSIGNLWFCTSEGIYMYEAKTKKVFNKKNNPNNLEIFKTNYLAQAIFFDDKQDIWYATIHKNTVCRYQFKTNAIKAYTQKSILEFNKNPQLKDHQYDGFVAGLGHYNRGKVIFALCENGLAVYDETKDNFNVIKTDNNGVSSLHNFLGAFRDFGMFVDKEENVWIFGDDGVEMFATRPTKFLSYEGGSLSRQGNQLPELPAAGFYQPKKSNDVYVGYHHYKSTSGIYQLDSNLQIKKHFYFTLPQKKENDKNQIWGIYEDAAGNILAPNQNKTMLKIDAKTGALTDLNDTALYGNINQIKKDEQGNLWIAHWSKGLLKQDYATGKTISFSTGITPLTQKISNVLSLFLDGDSVIWLGTNKQGVLRFDKRKNSYTEAFSFSNTDKKSISSNIVSSITAYNADTLLMATEEGLNLFNKKTKTFSSIPFNYLEPAYFVQEIFVDLNKSIWLIGLNQLRKVNLQTGIVTKYGTADGITNERFCGYYIQLNNGNCLVGTTKGFISFNPSEIKGSKPPPDVAITGFKVFESSLNIDSVIALKKPIVLSHVNNGVHIEFASLHFNDADNIKYYYQLVGVDDGWVLCENEPAAHYSHLAIGNYLFKVKCINKEGVESNGITQLEINITPPFYKTWWFVLIVVILFFSMLYLFFRYRVNNLSRIHALETQAQQLAKEKAQGQYENLKQHLNPHFLFNSLSSLSGLIKTDQKLAAEFIKGLNKIYRYILQSKDEELALLIDEIKFAESFVRLQQIRFGKGLQVTIDVPSMYSNKKIVPVTLQNLIENAIKHNVIDEESPLQINIFIEDDYLLVQNNLQKKTFVETSNKQGLHNLKSLYSFLSDKDMIIIETENLFTVKIPLL